MNFEDLEGTYESKNKRAVACDNCKTGTPEPGQGATCLHNWQVDTETYYANGDYVLECSLCGEKMPKPFTGSRDADTKL